MNAKPPRYAIVGMKFRGPYAFQILRECPHHAPVFLVREPTNKYDSNAVQVWVSGKMVGYIPANQNGTLSKYIDDHGAPINVMAFDEAHDTNPQRESGVKMLQARIHKGNNPEPLVEIA